MSAHVGSIEAPLSHNPWRTVHYDFICWGFRELIFLTVFLCYSSLLKDGILVGDGVLAWKEGLYHLLFELPARITLNALAHSLSPSGKLAAEERMDIS